MEDGLDLVSEVKIDINELGKEIEDLANANIINNSRIEQVNNSIKNVNKKIKTIEKDNLKTICIRNIKVFGKFIYRVLPYVLAASGMFAAHITTFKDVPFYPQKVNKIAYHETVITKDTIDDQMIGYKDPITVAKNELTDKAYYTTSWQMQEDGKYHRTIKEYTAVDFNVYEYQLAANNPDNNLLSVLDKEISKTEEVKEAEELSSEELAKGSSIKFVFHYSDEEDFIVEAQDDMTNFGLTMAYILVTLPLFLPTFLTRLSRFYSFREIAKKIIEENPTIDTKKLKLLLEEKKIKFELVKIGQVSLEDPITHKKSYITR